MEGKHPEDKGRAGGTLGTEPDNSQGNWRQAELESVRNNGKSVDASKRTEEDYRSLSSGQTESLNK